MVFSFYICRKFLVPLPPPHGIAYLGKYYLVIAAFCFIAMGNGLNLTDGLDGVVGGVSALAFVGMSIAVLPICPGESNFILLRYYFSWHLTTTVSMH